MKKNGLNKLLALLLALVMVLSLAACGNKAQDNGTADKDAGAVTDTDNNTGDNGDAAAPQDSVVTDGDVIGEGKTAFTVEVSSWTARLSPSLSTPTRRRWARLCWSWASWPVTPLSTACTSPPSTA